MRRIPILATTLVGVAIVAMIALGFWQLQRRGEKEALLARLSANETLPPIVFPPRVVDDASLFRRASAFCAAPDGWQVSGGRNAKGDAGFRQIARCRTGMGDGEFLIQIGVGHSATATPDWHGGDVRGYISHAPDSTPLIVAAFSHAPKPLMLVADPPQAGLDANPAPDLSAIPNNHLSYAVQWFLFAGIAMVIYTIALRRRLKA